MGLTFLNNSHCQVCKLDSCWVFQAPNYNCFVYHQSPVHGAQLCYPGSYLLDESDQWALRTWGHQNCLQSSITSCKTVQVLLNSQYCQSSDAEQIILQLNTTNFVLGLWRTWTLKSQGKRLSTSKHTSKVDFMTKSLPWLQFQYLRKNHCCWWRSTFGKGKNINLHNFNFLFTSCSARYRWNNVLWTCHLTVYKSCLQSHFSCLQVGQCWSFIPGYLSQVYNKLLWRRLWRLSCIVNNWFDRRVTMPLIWDSLSTHIGTTEEE